MVKVAVVVGIAVLMILSPMSGVAGATAPGDTIDQTQTEEVMIVENENEFKISDDVSVWEGTPLSLRADLEGAENVVGLHTIELRDSDGNSGPANRQKVGVFSTGDITLDLEDASGPPIDEYEGLEVKVIVGEVDSDVSIDNQKALTSLDKDSLQELNDNVVFDEEPIEEVLDEDGELSVEYDADSSGEYIAMVSTVNNGDEIDVDNNDLEFNGETTVLGAENFLVHDGSSQVSAPSSADLGDTVEFEADNIDSSSKVGHGIALYHEETFLDQETEFELTEKPDGDFSEDDIVIDTTLGAVDGISNFEDGVELLGFSHESDEVTGQTDIKSVFELATDGVDFDDEQLKSGDEILDASATIQENDPGDGTVSIDVETLEDWEEGDYQWIHLAADEDNEQLKTDAGTITIEEEDDSSGGSGGGGGGWAPVAPNAAIDITPKSPSVNEDVTFSGSESSIRSTPATDGISDYEWDINGETLSGEEVTTRFETPGDYEVDLTVTSAEGESDTVSTTVTVEAEEEPEPPVPTAAIDVDPDPAEVDEDVTLSAADSSTPEGEITDYEWDVQGETHSGEEITTTFDEAVEYTVSLTVTNDAGESDTESTTVTVQEVDDDDDDDADDGTPGFGVVPALVALLSIGLIGARLKE